jgi:hypothetical protein
MSDWINGRSKEILALMTVIDALNFDDEQLAYLAEYLADHCGCNLERNLYESKAVNTLLLNNSADRFKDNGLDVTTALIHELKSIKSMDLSIPSVDAYSLVALVQSAIVNLEIPSEVEKVGRNFVNGFCDRYREQMPTVVHTVRCGWLFERQMTADEFEEMDYESKFAAIAREIDTTDRPEEVAIASTDDDDDSWLDSDLTV